MRRKWVRTAEAAEALGVSTKFLLKHRGVLFLSGKHWLNVAPLSWRPTYRWDVDALTDLLKRPDAGTQLGDRQ